MSRIDLEFSDDELQRLAERISEMVLERLQPRQDAAGWLTTKQAADYLGMSLDSVHKLTASRSNPVLPREAGREVLLSPAGLGRVAPRG